MSGSCANGRRPTRRLTREGRRQRRERPYPGTASSPRSQNDDHLAGLAARYIEQNLDKTVGWDEVRQHLATQHRKTSTESARGLLLAVLDLEWTGTIQYDVDHFRRPGLPTDAKFAPLPDRTSADDEHTSVVINPVTCANVESPRSGRVTTGTPQARMCGVGPINAADQ